MFLGAKRLINEIQSRFKNNLRSVLVYGSSLRNSVETSDIDLIIILKIKTCPLTDLLILKKILKGSKKIDLQLLYEKELRDGNTFSLDTHGQFIIEELKNAVAIYGDNPFGTLHVSTSICQMSVIQKLQYYTFRARQNCMGYTFSTKDTSTDFHRKKLKMAMLDLLIANQTKPEKNADLIETFTKYFPGVITVEFEKQLRQNIKLEIEDSLPIYEALYDAALSLIDEIYFDMVKPKIAKKEGIFFEYLLPNTAKNTIPFIILCEGLPAKPSQDKLIALFARLGYGVIYPRYKGTWESEGTFLKEKPSKDISYLVKELYSGTLINEKNITVEFISLIGTSFGASVALSMAEDKTINQVIALSPVLSFEDFPYLDSLKIFLKEMYNTEYRFTNSTWKSLELGVAVPVVSQIKNSAHKIFLFGGGKDEEVVSRDIELWGNKNDVSTVIYDNVGHLSFSKIEGKMLNDIINLLKCTSSKF